MCGITGIVAREPVSIATLRAMTRALAHRGPDGEGLLFMGRVNGEVVPGLAVDHGWSGPANVGLGHRRLAILDLSSAGHQPMSYSGRYWITYNGEIYNYLELRAQLQADGYSFATSTDTEVIVAAYDRWGVDCLERFNGMWSFCLVDRIARRIFLARDRLGVKPLYLWRRGGNFVFASEIKSLLLHPEIDARINPVYCRRYLDDGANESRPETAFEGVGRLPAGSFIECAIDQLLDSAPEIRRYWTIATNDEIGTFDPVQAARIAEELRELLEDAVRLRLRSDVPVGSALSGGLDSSGIVSLVNGLLRRSGVARPRQLTFSSVYPGVATASIDESHYVKLLARELNVESHTVTPQVDQVIAEYESMVYAMDTPPDGSCMSGWFTFKLVGGSAVSVTLEGQGADEQLAGYLAYHTYFLAQAPSGAVRHGLAAMREPGARRYAAAGLALALLRRLGLSGLVQHGLSRWRPGSEPYLPLNQRLARDTTTLLTTLLHYGDRASMAHGIESRMPFVDYRVVEYCARMPAIYKLHDGWTKYVARLALERNLPPAVTWRRDKMGWPAPERIWLQGLLGGWALDRIQRSRFLAEFDERPLRRGELERADDLRRILRRLNLAIWHDVFVEGQAALRAAGGRELPGARRSRHPADTLVEHA